MIRAYVYPGDGEFCVLFTYRGEEFDHADGFEDEAEAVEAARRGVYGKGTVHMTSEPPSTRSTPTAAGLMGMVG